MIEFFKRLIHYVCMLNKNELCELFSRKQKIIRVATSMFADLGYRGVSIRMICEATDSNLAAISYHFGGKEKLYQECLNNLDPDVVCEFENLLVPAGDKEEFDDKIFNFCIQFLAFIKNNSGSVKLLINEMNSCEQIINLETHFMSPIVKTLESLFQSAVKSGILRTDVEIKVITRMIISVAVTQALYKSFKPFEEISDSELSRKIVNACTRSIYV